MIAPPLADESAVTALPDPVSYTFDHEQAEFVQLVFHPSAVTQTYLPPMSHTFLFCWSWIIGVTNRALGSQSGRGPPLNPVIACDTQVGLTKSANEWPPSVE